MWIANNSGCKDFVDQHWCMERCLSSGTIAELVLRYLKDGWKEKIQDPVSYHKFNHNRGQRALESYEDELGWSIKGPFDESVLLWHIATDFCFFLRSPPHDKAVQCRQMSNYMMCLLFVNPEMLLPGTRRNLFTKAYDELKHILGNKNLNPQSCCCCCCQQVVEKGLMETLISTMEDKSKKQDPEIGSQENFIDDAWDLAQELLNLGDDMWEVIKGVWVEMLCFSASRCRGYLHAKALGSGGEFLSYVWLLMFYMGMETLSERMQREELPSREPNNNATPAQPASDTHNGNARTSSPSGIRSRSASSPSHDHTGASTSSPEIRVYIES